MIHKGNEIIEIRDFLLEQLKDLSVQEWRLLGFYLEKINPRDISTRYVRIDLDDYCSIMGIGEDANIPYLKSSTRKLLQKVVDGPDPDKHIVYSQTVLFQRCRMMSDEHGKYYFELNAADDALPLLFDFKDHYIKARGMNIFELNSQNQIMMYLYICKQYGLGKRCIEVSIDELRDWLGIKRDEYQRFGNFNERVLSTCERALREHSELCFTYEKGILGAHGKCETIKIYIKENKEITNKLIPEQLPETTDKVKLEGKEIIAIVELCKQLLNKPKLTGIEKNWIQTWVKEYGMTEELVKEAFNDNSFRSYLSMQHINTTLTKWFESGIQTVEAAKKFCQEEHEKNKRKAAKKSSISGAKWKTGAEAGIAISNKENITDSEQHDKEGDISEDNGIPSDILDMFGDPDKAVDDDVDI